VDGSGLAEMVACELLFPLEPEAILHCKAIQVANGSNPQISSVQYSLFQVAIKIQTQSLKCIQKISEKKNHSKKTIWD